MLAFATPFSKFAGKSFLAIAEEYVDVGEGAVSDKTLQTLRNLSFNARASLTQITVPTGVDKIERSTFQNCTSLKTIYLHKNITEIQSKAFLNIGPNFIIYCETQEIANLLEKDMNYNDTTQIIVDASKF